MAWDGRLRARVVLVLRQHGITAGVCVADDRDHRRAQRTGRLWKAHERFDQKTGGSFHGPCLVFLVLVTPKRTVPVGFRFHEPAPERGAGTAVSSGRACGRRTVRRRPRPTRPIPARRWTGSGSSGSILRESG